MSRLEACIKALEHELRIKGEDAGFYTGIHEAIAIDTRILSAEPTDDEIIAAKKAYDGLDTHGGWKPRMKAALMTAFGGRKE